MSGRMLIAGLGACAVLSACAKPAPDETAPWPEWAFHHWVWEDESTQDSALALVDGYLARDIPVGAIIIDSPWETGYNSFAFDPNLFPDPQGMIDELHARNVRVLLWITSTMNLDSPELYGQGATHDYYMKANATGDPVIIDWWKGRGSLVDFFNEDAVAWWKDLMDQALALGIDGWKCDGTDPFVIAAPYSPGRGGPVTRAEYGHAYYRLFHEYTREVLGDDRLNMARPIDNLGLDTAEDAFTFAPTDINWAGWVGDQDATFDGIADALNNMYWSSKRGYVSFGSDIGGYREDSNFPEGRSKEVFLRWAELGAFTPVMENGGGGSHEPWAWDDETVDIYRRFVDLHYQLIPYLMEAGGHAFAHGASLMTFLDKSDYTYQLGPDVFVAPMLETGTSRGLTLPPEGTWLYLFDPSQSFAGGTQTTLAVPLGEFPVFVRAGSSIAGTLQPAP